MPRIFDNIDQQLLPALRETDGGTLLIGVNDNATVLGLHHECQTVHKKGRHGYELFLYDLLLNNIGKDLTPQLAITFHSLDGKDLCRVAIQPSPRPVFIKEGQFEHLYIRTGNSTRLLTTKEAIDYCSYHWKRGLTMRVYADASVFGGVYDK